MINLQNFVYKTILFDLLTTGNVRETTGEQKGTYQKIFWAYYIHKYQTIPMQSSAEILPNSII